MGESVDTRIRLVHRLDDKGRLVGIDGVGVEEILTREEMLGLFEIVSEVLAQHEADLSKVGFASGRSISARMTWVLGLKQRLRDLIEAQGGEDE